MTVSDALPSRAEPPDPVAARLRNEERLRALVESDAVTVWATDARGMVEDMPVWRRLTGQTPEQVRGEGWADALHPDDRERVRRLWWQAYHARATYECDYRLRMADGGYRWFHARGVPLLDADGQVREWVGTLHDVHEHRLAEEDRGELLRRLEGEVHESAALAEQLEAANQELVRANEAAAAAVEDEARLVETLHRIGVTLTSHTELHAIVQTATDEATALTAAQFGAFFYNVLDEQGGSYTLYTLSGAPRSAFERFPMPRNTEVFAPTFHGEGVVRSDDITRDPRYGRNAPHHGMPKGHLPVRSYLAVPVVSRTGEVLGGLFFGHAETGVFTERAERVAVGIAGWAAVAIDNGRLHEGERRSRAAAERAADRARRLLDVANALAGALSPEAVAEVAVGAGVAAVGASAGSLVLLDELGTEFETAGTTGYPDETAARFRRFPLTPGRPVSDAVLSGEPVLIAGREEWEARYAELSAVNVSSGFPALAAAPVLVEGRPVGAISFSFAEPQSFDPELPLFLRALAGQCASALERARLYDAERAARAEAESANRAKSQFLASMSHELRTPLNAIGGYVDLIHMGLRGPVTPEQEVDLEKVKRAQRHLLGLINDVLNFAKLEAGRIEFHIADVPLDAVLDEVEALIAPQAEGRGISFSRQQGGPAPVVRADREKLEQVLLNLLSNAVKFTDAGGSVWLGWQADAEAVRVHVRDTGVGIAADKLASVFEPFVQLDADLTRVRQGTGLGLAISRELARALGGEITAESRPGAGSTFTVHLLPASAP
ncbi:MAG TPA: GAF domain-containing protein [Longimicrobium sp.]|nr:GAF domain-containing protein [Longimicrobium sp.]